MENELELEIIDLTYDLCDKVAQIESQVISQPWSMASIKDLVGDDKAVCRVVKCVDDIIGYYSYYKILDEAYINNIAVSKSWQGKKIGNKLLADLLETVKKNNIRATTLEVDEKNIVAINLYKKFGFREEGRRKKYYNNTNDAIIMWRF